MIFYYKANGDLSFYTPSRIYQGSHKASEIYFVYPAGNSDVVTVAFNMPDGTNTNKLLMTKLNTSSIEDLLNGDGDNYSVYSYEIPNNITNQTGYFKVQFYITTPNGETISTRSVSIQVEHGVYTSTPTTTDVYEQVLQRIAQVQNNKQDALTFDETPTANSNNPVKSKGIKSYVDTATAVKNYELLEKIIIGYTALTEEPSDWTTNFASYYKNTGTAKEPTYTALTQSETFVSGAFYSYDGSEKDYVINRISEPNGTSYEFKNFIIKVKALPVAQTKKLYFTSYYMFTGSECNKAVIDGAVSATQNMYTIINDTMTDFYAYRTNQNHGNPETSQVCCSYNPQGPIFTAPYNIMRGIRISSRFVGNSTITIYGRK